MTVRSGIPFSLRAADSRAEISATGATVRALTLDGTAVLDGFSIDEIVPSGAGQVLAPWPNRLEDGQYVFDGVTATAPINELDRRNAIHGLVRWTEWSRLASNDHSVVLSTVIAPQPAYPWRLRLEITYLLMATSFDVRFVASNEDDRPAPFGIGFHPYLLAENGDVDAASLVLAADTHLRCDDRALPVGSDPTADGSFAALGSTEGLALTGIAMDDCFTDLVRGGPTAPIEYRPGPSSRPIQLTLGRSFTHVMCFTGDTLSAPRRRRAVAIEPMTCPPNALRSGDGVIVIAPGNTVSDSFTISLG